MNENPKKILIIEDEIPMARAMKLKLENEGFSVKTVHNGKDAIDALDTEEFDCALVDIILPQVDGFAVLDHLRSKNQDMKVIVLTNLGQTEDRKKIQKFNIDGYYVKSNISIASIVANVKNILA